MKKLFVFLLAALFFVPFFALKIPVSAETEGQIKISKTADSPEIDGVLDDCYELIANSDYDDSLFDINIVSPVLNNNMRIYACWNSEYLYIYLQIDCNGEHIAYMEDPHYIFNAHFLMTAILPDDPTREAYTGTQEGGGWDWTALSGKNWMYEYTTILNSKTGLLQISEHFGNPTGKTGFEYIVVSENGYDIYEQRIPMRQFTSSASAVGIVPKNGTLFGLGLSCGLTDIGDGYPDTERDIINFSNYFRTNKIVNNLVVIELVNDLDDDDDDSADESEPEISASEPADSSEKTGNETSVTSAGNSVNNSSGSASSQENSEEQKSSAAFIWIISGVVVVIAAAAAVFVINKKKK